MLIPGWTLPLRHISSTLGVARPFNNKVEKGWKKCTDPMVGGARSITLYDACTPSSGNEWKFLSRRSIVRLYSSQQYIRFKRGGAEPRTDPLLASPILSATVMSRGLLVMITQYSRTSELRTQQLRTVQLTIRSS